MSNSYSMEGTVPEPKNVIRHNLCTHRVYDSVEETKLKKKKNRHLATPRFHSGSTKALFSLPMSRSIEMPTKDRDLRN